MRRADAAMSRMWRDRHRASRAVAWDAKVRRSAGRPARRAGRADRPGGRRFRRPGRRRRINREEVNKRGAVSGVWADPRKAPVPRIRVQARWRGWIFANWMLERRPACRRHERLAGDVPRGAPIAGRPAAPRERAGPNGAHTRSRWTMAAAFRSPRQPSWAKTRAIRRRLGRAIRATPRRGDAPDHAGWHAAPWPGSATQCPNRANRIGRRRPAIGRFNIETHPTSRPLAPARNRERAPSCSGDRLPQQHLPIPLGHMPPAEATGEP